MTGEPPIGEDDLQGFVDGRLDPARRRDVEAFLEVDPAAAARVKSYAEQRQALRARLAFKAAEPIPARLRIATLRAERKRRAFARLTGMAAALAWISIGLLGGWSANAWVAGHQRSIERQDTPPIARDALGAHRMFVVEVAHPVEVGASQEGHLVQWLSKRLGRPLKVPDLSGFGYRLVGGRLLPAESEAAAQLMYEDERGLRLTLYTRAEAGSETAFRFESGAGASAFYWIDGGLGYVVSAAIRRETLLGIAEAVYAQLETAPVTRKPL